MASLNPSHNNSFPLSHPWRMSRSSIALVSNVLNLFPLITEFLENNFVIGAMNMNSAILIIDMQYGVLTQPGKAHDLDRIISRINLLNMRARTQQLPIFFMQYNLPGFLEKGSEAWCLHPDLLVEATDKIVHKQSADPFQTSDLQQQLEKQAISHLYIGGFATEFCIDSTVRRASSLGYQLTLLADAHTTHDKKHLSAKKIIEHHNLTLSCAPTIDAMSCETIVLDK